MREIKILIRPLTVHVSEERENLYARLKKAIEKAEAIVNDPDAEAAGAALNALRALAHLIGVGRGILKDEQLSVIERKLDETRKLLDEYKARGRKGPSGG